jgi:hypothetical protein
VLLLEKVTCTRGTQYFSCLELTEQQRVLFYFFVV